MAEVCLDGFIVCKPFFLRIMKKIIMAKRIRIDTVAIIVTSGAPMPWVNKPVFGTAGSIPGSTGVGLGGVPGSTILILILVAIAMYNLLFLYYFYNQTSYNYHSHEDCILLMIIAW